MSYFEVSPEFRLNMACMTAKMMDSFSTPAHFHKLHELVIVTEGHSTIISNDRINKINGSYLIFYPANIIHSQINDTSFEYTRYLLQFSPSIFKNILTDEAVSREFFDAGNIFICQLSPAAVSRAVVILEQIFSESGRYTTLSGASSEPDMSYLYRNIILLLAILLNDMSAEVRNSHPELYMQNSAPYIREVMQYIEQNISGKLTIDRLAGHFFVSRPTLIRDFKRIIGVNVNDYITSLRLSIAAYMLEKDCPLSEIAEKCGFSSVSYLISVFRRDYGLTPEQYRRKKSENHPIWNNYRTTEPQLF